MELKDQHSIKSLRSFRNWIHYMELKDILNIHRLVSISLWESITWSWKWNNRIANLYVVVGFKNPLHGVESASCYREMLLTFALQQQRIHYMELKEFSHGEHMVSLVMNESITWSWKDIHVFQVPEPRQNTMNPLHGVERGRDLGI